MATAAALAATAAAVAALAAAALAAAEWAAAALAVIGPAERSLPFAFHLCFWL